MNEPPKIPNQAITLAGRTIDFDTLEITIPPVDDAPARTVRLTLMEADLLRYLLDRPGKIIPRKELLEKGILLEDSKDGVRWKRK